TVRCDPTVNGREAASCGRANYRVRPEASARRAELGRALEQRPRRNAARAEPADEVAAAVGAESQTPGAHPRPVHPDAQCRRSGPPFYAAVADSRTRNGASDREHSAVALDRRRPKDSDGHLASIDG